MARTATPPPPPPAVSYPPPPPPAAVAAPPAPPAATHGHLSGEKIGLVAGGGVAVIGGIIAIISLAGHHSSPSLPSPAPPPAPVSSPAQPTQPTQPQPQSSTPTQPTPQSSQPTDTSPTPEASQPSQPTSSQGGSGIDLGNGATLTLASGWQVQGTADHQVSLLAPNSDAEYFAIGGGAKDQDAATQLQDDAQSFVSSDSALSNMKVGQSQTQTVGGSAGFTSVATMPFEATLTTNQGTTQVIGLFYDLFNPQGYSVLVMFDATSEDAYKASAPDSDTMTSSILG